MKGETGIDTSLKLAKIVGLTNLSDIDRVDVYKLETTPVDLSKISIVVKYDVVKNPVFLELVKKDNAIQAIDTSNLVKKTEFDVKIKDVQNKTTDQSKHITTILGTVTDKKLKQAILAINKHLGTDEQRAIKNEEKINFWF